MLLLTVGQRTNSDQILHLSARMRNERNTCLTKKIDGVMKRLSSHSTKATETVSTSSSEDGVATKRWMVLTRTMDKWIADNDRTLSTTTWLTYAQLNRGCVHCLKCSVCIRFRDKLVTCRNYSSAFKDHARSDMHQRAILLLKKASAKDITDYAPIARAFSSIDSSTEERVKKQFEIAYMLCKEKMSFSKMSAICELEQHHGVDLGQSCLSEDHLDDLLRISVDGPP